MDGIIAQCISQCVHDNLNGIAPKVRPSLVKDWMNDPKVRSQPSLLQASWVGRRQGRQPLSSSRAYGLTRSHLALTHLLQQLNPILSGLLASQPLTD